MRITAKTNVVAFYNATCDQLAITAYLRKAAKLSKTAPVYFDDADLVFVDKTIVRNALVNNKLQMQDLLAALVAVA